MINQKTAPPPPQLLNLIELNNQLKKYFVKKIISFN